MQLAFALINSHALVLLESGRAGEHEAAIFRTVNHVASECM